MAFQHLLNDSLVLAVDGLVDRVRVILADVGAVGGHEMCIRDRNKSVLVTCNIQMDLQVLGEINTSARMCIWNQK